MEEQIRDRWFAITMGSHSREELVRRFGVNAVVSRVSRFNLVHLDSPDSAEIERRIADFDPDCLLEEDCPLCQILRLQIGH